VKPNEPTLLFDPRPQRRSATDRRITAGLKESGIEEAEIYLLGTRLFMILEVNDNFSFEAKARADQQNRKVREWEELMWKFQSPLPQARAGEKWLLMEKIFELEK
jgi:L-rhamnose mutarotase